VPELVPHPVRPPYIGIQNIYLFRHQLQAVK
jgi:hypothetical protein